MATNELKDLFDRMQRWPRARQEDAARMLLEMEAQDSVGYHLSDEQIAEVERRVADPDPKFMTLAEVRARLSPTGA